MRESTISTFVTAEKFLNVPKSLKTNEESAFLFNKTKITKKESASLLKKEKNRENKK